MTFVDFFDLRTADEEEEMDVGLDDEFAPPPKKVTEPKKRGKRGKKIFLVNLFEFFP